MKFDTTYLTKREFTEFCRGRANGTISVYRARQCAGILNMDSGPVPCACPYTIPIIDDSKTGESLKLYCSKACHDAIEETPQEEDQDDNETEDW